MSQLDFDYLVIGSGFGGSVSALRLSEKGYSVAVPERGKRWTSCIHCDGCMVGCRHHAKNTLDKNYLDLAEKKGTTIVLETEVRTIRELPGGGYEVDTVWVTDTVFKRRRSDGADGDAARGRSLIRSCGRCRSPTGCMACRFG